MPRKVAKKYHRVSEPRVLKCPHEVILFRFKSRWYFKVNGVVSKARLTKEAAWKAALTHIGEER